MTIVCGTDFSEPSFRAVQAAACLAKRMNVPLHLVHTLDLPGADAAQIPDDAEGPFLRWGKTHLDREVGRLSREGVQAQGHLRMGVPDRVLLDLTRELSAKLVVVAAVGHGGDKRQLGSHAERLAQHSHVPVLVVRDAEKLQQWALGARPLRVVIGGDNSKISGQAMRWIDELAQWGPCEVTVVHVYWPPQEFRRLGLSGIRSYQDPDPIVTKTLEREYLTQFVADTKRVTIKLQFEPHIGRIGDRLAGIAAEKAADLLVVGSHARSSVERFWEGSVSHDALRCANVSVACIPSSEQTPSVQVAPLRTVLVASDFSEESAAAVALACSAVKHGGTIHLIHVGKPRAASSSETHDIFVDPSEAQGEQWEKLRTILAQLPTDDRVQAHAHLLAAHDPSTAIAQAAERLGVDLICMGTRGRKGVAKAILGSVSEATLSKTRRPILFAHAPTA